MSSTAIHTPISKPSPRRRLLPIRTAQAQRRHACGRRDALRTWLAAELADVDAAISGNGVDIIIDKSGELDGGEVAQAVVDDAVPDSAVDSAASATPLASVTLPRAPSLSRALKRFMESPHLAHFGLFVRVRPPPHIFSVIVEKGPGDTVTHVLLLNPWVYGAATRNYVRFAVALTLYQLLAMEGTQHFRDLLARTHFTRPLNVTEFNLQSGDPGGGFCQHWDSFLIHSVLVEGRQPHDVFTALHNMTPRQRGTLIVDWANWAADRATGGAADVATGGAADAATGGGRP